MAITGQTARAKVSALLALVLALAVACGTAANPPVAVVPTVTPPVTSEEAMAPAETPLSPSKFPTKSSSNPITRPTQVKPDPSQVPELDTGTASVELSEIVFDTFGRTPSRYLPLSEADGQFIRQLRDAIAPVYQPVYGKAGDLSWLAEDDLILGYVAGNQAFAYPLCILNFHELVNDHIDGTPVLISYCPLCASGVVFHRELDGQTLVFGNTSALYQSDLVMYDHQTGSYWFQTGGEAVVGPLTGSHLNLLPSVTMSWTEWQELYPDSWVLTGTVDSPRKFAASRYGRNPFGGYQSQVNRGRFAFPVREDLLDDRLRAGELVLTVEIGAEATAYPLDLLGAAAVNDTVAEQPVVVFSQGKGRGSGAFSPVVAGQLLTFVYDKDSQEFLDQETGSAWDLGGQAVDGPLAGTRLERLNTRRAYWFSIAIALPQVHLYQP